jgi:hypothetical protein
MKAILSHLYQRLGIALGLDHIEIRGMSSRSPEQIESARRVFNHLRSMQEDWKRQGVTADEVMGWIREGRR